METTSDIPYLKIIKTPEEDYQEHHRKTFSLDYLQSLKLPKVPDYLEENLMIGWVGRKGHPARSAIDAIKDGCGNPMIVLSLVYKQVIVEELFPFKLANQEMKIFCETAEELCCE